MDDIHPTSVDPPNAEPPGGSGAGRIVGALSWVRDLAFSVLIAVVLIVFIYQPVKVEGTSMEPGLSDNERIFINKFTYKLNLGDIRRGDTVVFWYPADTSKSYIKRVIGLPGDHVACCTGGDVTVNGVKLDETSYLYPGAAPSTLQFKVTVPAGRLWVMGDNRAFSDDSRYHQTTSPGFGTIPANEVAGRAFLIIWPLSQFRDLPIPATFQQAAFNAGPAGLAGGGVIALGVPVVFWRHRRRLTR